MNTLDNLMNSDSAYYIQAYTEVHCFLKYLPKEYVDRVPNSVLQHIESKSNDIFNMTFDTSKGLNEQPFSDKAKDMISVLKYNYWSTDEERAELTRMFFKNEIDYKNSLNLKP